MSANHQLYVATRNNLILRKTGPTWERWDDFGEDPLVFSEVHGNTAGDTYALASDGSLNHCELVLRLSNGGWTREELPDLSSLEKLNDLWVGDSGRVFTTTNRGRLFIKDDGDWSALSACADCSVDGMWAFAEDDIYLWAAGYNDDQSGLTTIHYDGTDFLEEGSFPNGEPFACTSLFNKVCGSSFSQGYLTTYGSAYSFDGSAFTDIWNDEDPLEAAGMACCPDGTLYVSGAPGLMRYSSGVWTRVDDKTSANLSCAADNELCYVDESGVACLDGETPVPESGPLTRWISDAWVSLSGAYYLVGKDGLTRVCEGEAELFEPEDLFTPARVTGSSDEDVWVSTSNQLYNFDGVEWSAPFTFSTDVVGSPQVVLDIHCAAADRCWAALNDGTVSGFDGTEWKEPVQLTGEYPARFITGTPDGDVFAVSDDGVHRLEGEAWVRFLDELPGTPSSMWSPSADEIWITGFEGDDSLQRGDLAALRKRGPRSDGRLRVR